MATNSGVSEKITFARELKNINEQIKAPRSVKNRGAFLLT